MVLVSSMEVSQQYVISELDSSQDLDVQVSTSNVDRAAVK